jgi:hypothetical protein
MLNLNFSCESWNIRGLGDHNKYVVVKADICDARPQILALQETMLSTTSSMKAASFLLSNLRSFETIYALGSTGRILTAWDLSLFTLLT